MADNQHMRNQYRADTEDKDDDPLAELARFVEFEDDSDVPASSSEEPDLPDISFDLESEFFTDLEEGGTSDADAHLTSPKPDLGETSHDIAEHVSFEQSIAEALESIADNPEASDEEGYRQREHEDGSEDPAFGEEDPSRDAEARLTDVREDHPATSDDETMPEFELSEEDMRAYPDSDEDAAAEMTVYEGVAENGENATESPGHLPAVDFDALFAGDIDNIDEPNSEANDDGSVERTGHLREELVRDIEEQSGLNSVVPDNSKAAPASQAWDSKGDMNRPTDHTKAEGEPENEFWPNAKREKDEEVLSLEAELQAAFDALEGKAASPPSAPSSPVSSGVSLRETEPASAGETRTGDAAKFTEALAQLQNAGRTRQTPAPQPVAQPERPPVPEREPPRMPSASNLPDPEPMSGDDDDMPLGDLLAAEMEAIENLTAESNRRMEEVPFNPAEIVEDVSAPEAMGTVDVPDHQFEEPRASVPLDEDLNLSLEDELAALSAEAEDHGYVQTDLKSEEEYYAQHADPEVAAELAAHASALSHDFGSHSIPGKEEIAAPDWDDQALDEEYEDVAAEVDDNYQPRQVEPEEWQPDDSEFDAGFSEVDFSEIDEPYEQTRNGRTLYAIAAVVIAGIVVGGAGFYFWNSSLVENGMNGEPPIITAEKEPVKIKPDDPGGTTVPNQDLAVYDRVSGSGTRTPRQENLVTTEEEPVDIVQRTLDPDTLPMEGRGGTAGMDATKAEDRLVPEDSINPDPSATTADTLGITPKRVRTLIVKPDGTIVSREAEPGAPEIGMVADDGSGVGDMPVTTKAGPDSAVAAPGSDAASASVAVTETGTLNPDAGSGGTVSGLPPIEANLRDSGAVPVPVSRPTGAPGGTENVATGSVGATAENANTTNVRSSMTVPVPTPRPSDQPVNIVEAVTERGNLAGETRTAGAGSYMVQISSQVTEEAARADYQRQAKEFASVLGGLGVDIQRADIPGRGVFYRVRVPAGSKQAATDLCERLKSVGGNCFVAK